MCSGWYLIIVLYLASLPLLVGILVFYNSLGSVCLFLLSGNSSLVGGLFYVCTVFAFLVRILYLYFIYDFLGLMLKLLCLGL